MLPTFFNVSTPLEQTSAQWSHVCSACVLFFFYRVCVCVCVRVHADSQLSLGAVEHARQPSQTQPGLTGTGERLSLARVRHATPPPSMYGRGKIKRKSSAAEEMNVFLC